MKKNKREKGDPAIAG